MNQVTNLDVDNKPKKLNKNIVVLIFAVCVILALVIFGITFVNNVIIPASKYNDAIVLLNKDKYIQAYNAFVALGEYKDSSEKANQIVEKHSVVNLSEVSVGDLIFLGEYEGKKLNWTVAEVRKDYAILICNSIVDLKPYNYEAGGMDSNEPSYHFNEWPKCTLRTWINKEFFKLAFNNKEKSFIKEASVPSAGEHKDEGTVLDFVYIPSEREVDLAVENGWDANNELRCNAFWFRGSTGTNGISADGNNLDRTEGFAGNISEPYGVIPIIWIKADTKNADKFSVFDKATSVGNYSSGSIDINICSRCDGTGRVNKHFGNSWNKKYGYGYGDICGGCGGDGRN